MRVEPSLTVDGEFQALGDLGNTGTLNDRQFSYLRSVGQTGALPDMLTPWIRNNYRAFTALSSLYPYFVMDPTNNFYGLRDTLDSISNIHEYFDSGRTGSATCIDADGSLVLGLHNLLDTRLNDGGQWTPTGLNSPIQQDTDSAGEKRYLLTEDASTGIHAVAQTFAAVSGKTYTIDVRVKLASGVRDFGVALSSGIFGSGNDWVFDLANVEAPDAGAGTNASSSIKSLGDGEYLCRLTADATSSGNPAVTLKIRAASGGSSYTGDGTSGMYVSQPTVYESSVGPRAELVVDGDFPDLSNWDLTGSAWTASGNKAVGVATGGVVERLAQTLSNLTVGNEYRLSFTVDGATNLLGFDLGVDVSTTTEIDDLSITANGTFVYTFTATSTSHTVSFRFSAISEAGDAANISNVSVLPVTPQMQKSSKDNSYFMENETGDAKYALRIDHTNSVSRTNYVPYGFINATDWNSESGTTTTTLSDNALGMFDGVRIISDGTNDARLRIPNIVPTDTFKAGRYTLWAYYKYGSSQKVRIQFVGGTTTANMIVTATGNTAVNEFTNGDASFVSASTEEVSNGIYRVQATFDLAVDQNAAAVGVGPFSNTLGEYVDAYFVQLEEGSEATDFIPTTGAAVTVVERIPEVLAEPAGTNEIRNSTMQGASVGLLSAGGSLPTNWSKDNMANADTEIVAIGEEDGFSYIDVRFNGTPLGSNVQLQFDNNTQASAGVGEDWTGSVFAKIVGGDLTNINSVAWDVNWYASGSYIGQAGSLITLTSDRQRFVVTDTTPATTTSAAAKIKFNWDLSGAIDITVRFYAPQLEKSHVDTSVIPTTTAAATRVKDEPTRAVPEGFIQGEGSIYFEGSIDYETGGSGFPRVFQIDDGSNNDRVGLIPTESSGALRVSSADGGVGTGTGSRIVNSGEAFKASARYADGDLALSVDGQGVESGSPASISTALTTVRIGDLAGVQRPIRIRDFRLFPYSSPAATPGWSDAILQEISGA